MQQAQRLCAIKRVAFASLAEKQQIENEAHILQQSAPLFRFVPDLYDFWSDATNTFLVMECIEGPTLDQTSLPWPPGKVEQFLRTLLNYLENLHATSTIHRDLKPWNIKQTPQGRYVLLDFGIAKQGNGTLTNARGIGTVNYAPPEQVHGQPTDERSDLYSLAATAYSLLTDQSPLQARMQAGGILPSPAHLVAGVSPRLEQTIMRMLESEPANRPQNAREALKLLDGNGEELATIRLTDASHSNQPTASSISPPIGSTAPAGATSATPAAPAAYPLAPPMPANPSAATLRSPPIDTPICGTTRCFCSSNGSRFHSWPTVILGCAAVCGSVTGWGQWCVVVPCRPFPKRHLSRPCMLLPALHGTYSAKHLVRRHPLARLYLLPLQHRQWQRAFPRASNKRRLCWIRARPVRPRPRPRLRRMLQPSIACGQITIRLLVNRIGRACCWHWILSLV